MKNYPKRKNKLYKEIEIKNVHLCDFTCERQIYHVDDVTFMYIQTLEDGKCEKYNKITNGFVKLSEFEVDNPRTIMNNLLYNDVVLDGDLNVYITFPIHNKSTFKIKNDKELKLSELLNEIKRIYKYIYDVEYETCTPIKYTFIEDCKKCSITGIQSLLNKKNKIFNEDCIICLENNDVSIKLDCGHILHQNCINQWIEENRNTCPICREYINKCSSCGGELQIENEYENKVIPMEHRSSFVRNTTDGDFGVYGVDFEQLCLNRIFYSKNDNKLYLKF